jgi:hypothetical protein
MALESSKLRDHESGQAVVEYLVLLTVVVLIFFFANRQLGDLNLGQALVNSMSENFQKAYRYGYPYQNGHPVSRQGRDQDDQTMSPAEEGNRRLFVNPEGT